MSHFFVTGHTGFKGAWLTHLLIAQGHQVSGYSLDPEQRSLFDATNLKSQMTFDFRNDIRDRTALEDAFARTQPDYVFHLAAQALVGKGYRDPVNTYGTNILGTLNVLTASAKTDSVKAQLIATSDKVYSNNERDHAFTEDDFLQGADPYSQSKASADQLAQEWIRSGRTKPGAIARAGNVIGPGDYAENRLIPDLVRAVQDKKPIEIRYPNAIRPWQHVLDCVYGYSLLLDFAGRNNVTSAPGWNFGPNLEEKDWSVKDVLRFASDLLGNRAPEIRFHSTQLREHSALRLSSKKANSELNWWPRIPIEEAVEDSLAEALAENAWFASEHVKNSVVRFLATVEFPRFSL